MVGGRRSPGERDLVPAGEIEQLFNGRDMRAWTTISGGWSDAKNQEGATVLEGKGEVRRLLTQRDTGGDLRPLDFYRLTLVVDVHDATAVEVQFDFANGAAPTPRQDCRFVRIDRERATLGRREGGQERTRQVESLAHASDSAGPLHVVQLERQSGGWWVFVDERFLGSAAPDHDEPASEFRLLAEGGPSWFSDFTVERLIQDGFTH
jgi:hypothetical protein